MTETSGSFTGRPRMLNVMSLADVPDHHLEMAEVTGSHRSPDENWDKARVTYWGVSDLVAGNGTQRGYYVTEHTDGGRDVGSFEGKVTTSQGATEVEGTWQAAEGTGKYAGIRAQGKFKMRLNSAMEVECSWQGQYELAPAVQAA